MSYIYSKISISQYEKVHYLHAPHDERSTILLLHGINYTSDLWVRTGTIDKLNQQGHNVYAVDIPSFGYSEKSIRPTYLIINEFLCKNGLKDVILLGPSMGGRLGLVLAKKYTSLFKALILIGVPEVHKYIRNLHKIIIPSLLVWGESDHISPMTNLELLKKYLKNVKRTHIMKGGHSCYIDNSYFFNVLISEFIVSLP